MRAFIVLFLLALQPLYSNQGFNQEVPSEVHDDAVPSLVNLTSLPSALVNGCVNVISGDLCEVDHDDVVSGPVPYILGHSYFSSSLEEGNLGDGWNFMHHHLLEVFQPNRIEYVRKGDEDLPPILYPIEWTPFYQQYTGEYLFGMGTLFDPSPFPTDHHPIHFLHSDIVAKDAVGMHDRPLSDIGDRRRDHHAGQEGPPSGTTQHDPIFLSIYDPYGGRLLFKTDYDDDHHLRHFKLVTKNSGYTNVSHGQMSGKTDIKNIKVWWHKSHDTFHVTLGDGTERVYERQERYHHDSYYRDYQLRTEKKPSGHVIEYEYKHRTYEIKRITTKNEDNADTLNWIEFEQRSVGDFAKHHSLHINTSDKREHVYKFERVKGSSMHGTYCVSKICPQGMPVTTFSYTKKDHHHKIRVEEKKSDDNFYIKTKYYKNGKVRSQRSPVGPNGKEIVTHRYFYYHDYCNVQDAYKNYTRYYWDKHKRLTRISKFDSSKKLIKKELFTWSDEGRLKRYTLKDENSKTRLTKKYTYDSRGNVKEERLIADDESTTTYKYSDDGFNLKTSECDPHGNYTYYEYKKGTNLLTAKLSCEGKNVRKRELFKYDKNGICIEQIVDDGEQATERHITRITPRDKMPHYGEPVGIAEYYYDFNTNKEVWLKLTYNHYDANGFVRQRDISYNDSPQETYWFEYYDDTGRLKRVTDPMGNWEYFEYDTAGRLTLKHGKRPDVDWHYVYDAAGRLITETEKHQDGLELITRYEYDLLGRKTAVINPQGNTTRYEYDALNRITAITHPDNSKKTCSYEKLGSIVTETDELGNVTKTTYNARGKISDQKLPDGQETHYEYDRKCNLIKEVHPNGAVTHNYYDYYDRPTVSRLSMHGELLSRNEVVYNHIHPIKEIGPTGETIDYSYDLAGNKASQTFQNERTTLFAYDSRGRLVQEKSPYFSKSWEYDELNRPTSETLFDSEVRSVIRYGYDYEGNKNLVTRNIDGQDAHTHIFYRPHGLPDTETDAEGNQTFYKYHYGQPLLCKETIDARGCRLEEVFDIRGNLATVTRFDPANTLLAKKNLFYDAANNLIRTDESVIIQGQEQKIITTELSYNKGHLSSITEASGTPEEKHTQYFYNSFGQLETISYADSSTLHHSYDGKGRLEHYYSSDGTIDYRYRYDASDRILEVTNNVMSNKTIRTYNPFGELESETLETGLTLHYSYDKAGRCNELTLPDSSKIAYHYSAFLESIDRLDAHDNPRYSHKITKRDLSGFIQTAELANHTTISYNRDKLGRTTNIFHAQFEQKTTGFDPVGNLLGLNTRDPQGTTDKTFSYDFLSQLTKEPEHTYSYDSLYNRLSLDDKPYVVNSLHSVLSDSKRAFTYDLRGNRVADDTATYSYDALDRLIEVKTATQKYVYSYDAFNRRLSKDTYNQDIPVQTTHYLYAIDNEIGALENKTLIELRILGEGLGAEIGAAIALELSGNTYIPLHDRQGSVIALLDTTGKPIESYRYDAFGNETSTTPALLNPWRFSSKRLDPETGFIYFGRRFYDPTLGKWLTQDPLGLKAGPNLYTYVLNCPLTKFDLYGLLGEDNADTTTPQRIYSASYGIGKELQDRQTHERDTLRKKVDEVKNRIQTFHEFKQELFHDNPDPYGVPERSFLERTTEHLYNAADDAFLAADLAGLWLMSQSPAWQGKAASAGTLVLSKAGKSIVQHTRSLISPSTVQKTSGTLRDILLKKPRKTTDFILAEVEINGVKTTGLVDVKSTLIRIKNGIKHPHPRDGSIHYNAEKQLPIQNTPDYYHEHVLSTPGTTGPGKQRIVTGKNGELYYTNDHYKTFTPLN